MLVEQCGQGPQDAALGLAAQPEEDEVLPRQDRIRYLRNNRTVAGEVVGVVELADAKQGWDARYTDAKVTHREWVCK